MTLYSHSPKDFPADQVEAENRRLNKAKDTLKAQKTELEVQVRASKEAVISIPKLETFIERMQAGIATLDFEGKRQALDMLNITVWLDGETVEITGTIDLEDQVLRCLPHREGALPLSQFLVPAPFRSGGKGVRSLRRTQVRVSLEPQTYALRILSATSFKSIVALLTTDCGKPLSSSCSKEGNKAMWVWARRPPRAKRQT